jgi:Ca2+-binding EF-hand superfamily protein
MKLPRIHSPLFAFALVTASVAAFAEPATKHQHETAPEWSKSDTDRDGFLSKEELIPFPGTLRNFEKIDTDGDGKISEAEYTDWRESKKGH